MANRVWFKMGVMGDLRPECRRGFRAIAKLYWDHGRDLYVTSIREGNHSPGSLHYMGFAFDFQQQGISVKDIEDALLFERGWFVLEEATHIHVQREGF